MSIPAFRTGEHKCFRGRGEGRIFGRWMLNEVRRKALLKELAEGDHSREACEDIWIIDHFTRRDEVITRGQARSNFNREWDAELAASC